MPATVAVRLVPTLTAPDAFSPIVNAHFRCAAPADSPLFVGVIDGAAEWIFRKREVLSVTVSAADRMVDRPADILSEILWRDVALAYRLPVLPVPPSRIVKERRATFLASPEQLRRRPGATTRWRNLLLAGDYTDTGLPATIEGAIASGVAAGTAGDRGTRRSPDAGLGGRWRLRCGGDHRDWRIGAAHHSMNGTINETAERATVAASRGDVGRNPPGLDTAIARAIQSLLASQHADGHWVFELEADATIPSEYILLQHYLDRIEPGLQARIADFIRARQGEDGGWPLFHGGALDLSCSVKAYFALKAAGDPADAPAGDMARARAAILRQGGARRCNVFTRITLALFGEVPWRAVPAMPVEIMLLPGWSPFHISKVSYWSRTVLVPLLVLMALRPQARNPRGITVRELFVEPPDTVRDWITGPGSASPLALAFGLLDRVLRRAEPLFPGGRGERGAAIEGARRGRLCDRAAKRRRRPRRHLSSDGQLSDDVRVSGPSAGSSCWIGQAAAAAVDKVVIRDQAGSYCQPCLSPVWDTALACHALMEAEDRRLDPLQSGRVSTGSPVGRCSKRLAIGPWSGPGCGPEAGRSSTKTPTILTSTTPPLLPWLSTASIGSDTVRRSHRAAEWVTGMRKLLQWRLGLQVPDADVTRGHWYLNHILFADHGALLDLADGRCQRPLSWAAWPRSAAVLTTAPPQPSCFLCGANRKPTAAGSGRWGTNYIYGTWSVLAALNAAGVDPRGLLGEIRCRAVDWLLDRQRVRMAVGARANNRIGSARLAAKRSTARPRRRPGPLLALMAAGR